MFKNILVIGNLNSGKTTISKKLERSLNIRSTSIDDLRVKYGDGTFSKEYLSWSKFFEIIEDGDPIILEFSGAGIHKHAVKELLNRSDKQWLIIFVSANHDDIIARMDTKKLHTPYPWKISGFDNLKLIQKELEDDWDKNYWLTTNTRTIKITNTNSIDQTFDELKNKLQLLLDE